MSEVEWKKQELDINGFLYFVVSVAVVVLK